jgi:lactoylglutathione lyase
MSQVCVISIYVPKLQEAVDFYTKVLNFEVNKQYGPKIVSLVNGELPLVLEESEQVSYKNDRHPSGIVLALKTDDIEQTLQQLKASNVDFLVGVPTDCPPGKFISFRDPFGNVIEFLQFAE